MRLSVPSQWITETPQKTSDSFDDLHFDDWSSLLPWNKFFAFDTQSSLKRSRKRYVSFDSHNRFDSYDGHDSHDKFSNPGQAGKGLILPEDLLLADTSMVFHLQQFRHMVCGREFVWVTYTTADDQAGGTLRSKGTCGYDLRGLGCSHVVIALLKLRVPDTIVKLYYRLLRQSYPSTLVSMIILLTWQMTFQVTRWYSDILHP